MKFEINVVGSSASAVARVSGDSSGESGVSGRKRLRIFNAECRMQNAEFLFNEE